MGEIIKAEDLSVSIRSAISNNNLASLSDEQKDQYYLFMCDALKLNPLTNPLQWVRLNGKLQLYAAKNCAEQLRMIHKLSIKIKEARTDEKTGQFIVVAEGVTPDGRSDSSLAAVSLQGLKGDALSNAMMKCETKAKRRLTLSMCSTGLIDESEVVTIPNREIVDIKQVSTPTSTDSMQSNEKGAAPSNTGPSLNGGGGKPKNKDIKMLFNTGKQCGWSNLEIQELMIKLFDKDRTADLTLDEIRKATNEILSSVVTHEG